MPQEKNAMRIGRRRLEKSSSRRVIREKGKGWKRLFDTVRGCIAFSLLKAVCQTDYQVTDSLDRVWDPSVMWH